MPKKIKALVVFSGGLDSLLAIKTLEAQKIDVTALCFESDFYDAKKARLSADASNIKLVVKDVRKEMFELSKNPPNGYGKNMNPCIDCHGMMFRLASDYMKENNIDILASGEVLGQRPFSQKKDALRRVMNLAGIEVLRPLSAKLLQETEYEKNGLVDRKKLHSLSGRGREGQFELAKTYKLKEYPSPAGGCLLTDPVFSSRYKQLLSNWSSCSSSDIGLIKNGRVFWFQNNFAKKILVMVGRNENENENLERLAQSGDIVLQLKDINGPTVIIRGALLEKQNQIEILVPIEMDKTHLEIGDDQQILLESAKLCGFYLPKARGQEVAVSIKII